MSLVAFYDLATTKGENMESGQIPLGRGTEDVEMAELEFQDDRCSRVVGKLFASGRRRHVRNTPSAPMSTSFSSPRVVFKRYGLHFSTHGYHLRKCMPTTRSLRGSIKQNQARYSSGRTLERTSGVIQCPIGFKCFVLI